MSLTAVNALISIKDGTSAPVNLTAGAIGIFTPGNPLIFALQNTQGIQRAEFTLLCPGYPGLHQLTYSWRPGQYNGWQIVFPASTAVSNASVIAGISLVVTVSDSSSSTVTAFNFLESTSSAPSGPPIVVSLSPPAGPQAGGTFISVIGTGIQLGAVILVDGNLATGNVVVSSTNITATTAAFSSSGFKNVVVRNPDLQTGTLAASYSVDIIPTARGAALKQWHDSDPATMTMVSTKVSQWNDISGNLNHVAQATDANRPTRTSPDARYNNRTTVHFPSPQGNVDLHINTFASGNQAVPYTIYWVGQDSFFGTDCTWSNVGGNPFGALGASQVQLAGSAGTLSGQCTVANRKSVFAWVSNGASTKLYGQSPTGLLITGTVASDVMSGMVIGNGPFGGNSLVNGDVAEIIRIDGADSPAQILQMMSYLSGKYADQYADVIFSGNSLIAGSGATDPNNTDFVNVLGHQLPNGYTYQKDGNPGFQTFSLLDGLTSLSKQTIARKQVWVLWEITNDIATGGYDAATSFAHLVSWSTKIRQHGGLVLMLDCIARNSVWTGANETTRLAVNPMVAANSGAVFDRICSLSLDPRLSNAADPLYYTDGIHLTDLGYNVVANLVKPILLAM